MISNFDVSCFKPVSYELRLKSISALGEKSELRELPLPYSLKSGGYVIGNSVETLNIPSTLLGLLVPTSFSIRFGIDINCGKIDPTFKGQVSFGIYNLTKRSIKLEKNMRLVHLLVSEFKGETIPLETKYFGGTT